MAPVPRLTAALRQPPASAPAPADDNLLRRKRLQLEQRRARYGDALALSSAALEEDSDALKAFRTWRETAAAAPTKSKVGGAAAWRCC